MSTVLTKPVLLDETGQAIVGKLDEIKEAIDNGGTEKYPVLIHITTMPTKTSYIAGEQLNLAGMVVKAVFSNNVEYDVTDQCTFSPANGTVLTSSDTSVTATYTWHPTGTSFTATQAITVKEIVGISVATPPTKTDYIINEALDLTGMVVHLDYDDNTYDDITADCTYVPANGATLDNDTITEVNISYTDIFGRTYTDSQAIEVIIPIYGVRWDGTASSALTRTDTAADFIDPSPAVNNGDGSSPFDNLAPWKDITIVEDPTVGSLVKIPKFYYKWTVEGATMQLQVSPLKIDNTWETSPGHSDRGDGKGERDWIYVGRYLCSSAYKSTTGVAPLNKKTIADFRSNIHNLGTDIWQYDNATRWTILMLYLVEYADWDSQKVIGYGGGTSTTPTNTGSTDSMGYHTGTSAETRNQYGRVQYRNIEDLWSNAYTYCEGIISQYGSVMATKKPSDFGNIISAGVSLGNDNQNGYIKSWAVPNVSGYKWALRVGSVNSAEGYICDQTSLRNDGSWEVMGVGGSGSNETKAIGIFYKNGVSQGSSSAYYCARLQKLP